MRTRTVLCALIPVAGALTLAAGRVSADSRVPASLPAARSGLRLDGTFIQYQDWMMRLSADEWGRELDSLHRAGLKTIVIQWLARNGGSFMPPQAGATDPTETILSYADAHGMDVFLGLFMDDAWWKWGPNNELPARLMQSTRTTVEQAWSRYGHHRSLAGWYIPPEPADTLDASCIPSLRAFFRETAELCDRLSGGKPVAFAPFLTGQVAPDVFEKNYEQLLAGSGIDIVMLQDGVGVRRWDNTVHSRVVPFFRAMRNACLAAGVELWSDVEIFHDDSDDPARPRFRPADTARLGAQLAAEAPFVARFIAFDCFHYMSPHRGEAQRRFHEAYLREFVDRPFFPVSGPSVIIDPSFPYYRDRSPDSIAAEIRANGYSIVRCVAEPSARVEPKLVDAFHRAGIGVWIMVFGNGTYSRQFLPEGWQAWAMITRTELAGGSLSGFQRLCLNNAGYREWKKRDLAKALAAAPFDALEIAESHWPEYPGVSSPAYGCFCESCRTAFTAMFPEESALPDVLNADSPRSPSRNPELWAKWLRFRTESLTRYLDDIVNGPGGLRAASPQVKVAVWGLGLSEPDGVRRVREDSGQDAGGTARRVRPDFYCFQTHWPDWMRADLAPDYVHAYQPFIDQLREHAPHLPLIIQADVGSTREAIRDRAWIEAFERRCQDMGVQSTCLYEYFIAGWTYHEPPRAVHARRVGNEIEICFTRRLDPQAARAPGTFRIDGRDVLPARLDGCLVYLPAPATATGGRCEIAISGQRVDAGRWLFPGMPVKVASGQKLVLAALR